MATTAYAITATGIITGGFWDDIGALGPVAHSLRGSLNLRIDFVATGTDLTMHSWFTLPATVTAEIDGGSPVTLTLPANQTWGDVVIFSSLTDAAHSVTIRGFSTNFDLLDRDAAFSLTGASPAIAAPTALNGTLHVLTGDLQPYVSASPGWGINSDSGYPAYTLVGTSSLFGGWTDCQIDLPSGSCTSLLIWAYQNGQTWTLRVDGTDQPSVTANTSQTWDWITLATGLSGSREHTYSIHLSNPADQPYVWGVLPVGGSGLTGTTPAAAREAWAFYGDSITAALSGTANHSEYGFAHLLGRQHHVWVANRGISGSTLRNTGTGGNPSTVQSGEARVTDDLVNLTCLIAGTVTPISPTKVVILYGINDFNQAGGTETSAQYQASLIATLNAIKSGLPDARIYLLGLTDYQGADISAWRTAQQAAAATTGVSYYATDGFLSPNYTRYTADGLHPSASGYAQVIVPFLDPILTSADSASELSSIAASLGVIATAIPNLDAAVSSRLPTSSYTAPPSSSVVTAAVWAAASRTLSDKTGFVLDATGLDSISVADPGGVAGMTSLPKMIVALWRRAYAKTILTKTGTGAGTLKTYANDGTTVNTTETWTDDGTKQTQGAAT